MVTVIVLIMMMTPLRIEAFAVSGTRNLPISQRIWTKSQRIGSPSAVTAAIIETPTAETKPKIFRLYDKLKSTILYPTVKARQVKEFFDTQLPMLRYLWPRDDLRLRVFLVLSMVFMFLGKWFNVKVPFILQRAIDTVSKSAMVTGAGGRAGIVNSGAAASAASLLITPGVLQGATAAIAFYGRSSAPPC